MGLGKTVQTLALLSARTDKLGLVIAPTSVASNWKAEAAKFAPNLNAQLLSETDDRSEMLKALGPGDLLLASYGLLVNELDSLKDVSWGVVVLDEAQAIKNHTT